MVRLSIKSWLKDEAKAEERPNSRRPLEFHCDAAHLMCESKLVTVEREIAIFLSPAAKERDALREAYLAADQKVKTLIVCKEALRAESGVFTELKLDRVAFAPFQDLYYVTSLSFAYRLVATASEEMPQERGMPNGDWEKAAHKWIGEQRWFLAPRRDNVRISLPFPADWRRLREQKPDVWKVLDAIIKLEIEPQFIFPGPGDPQKYSTSIRIYDVKLVERTTEPQHHVAYKYETVERISGTYVISLAMAAFFAAEDEGREHGSET